MSLSIALAKQPSEPTRYRGFQIFPVIHSYGCDALILDDSGFCLQEIKNIAASVPATIKRMQSYLNSQKVRRKLRRLATPGGAEA